MQIGLRTNHRPRWLPQVEIPFPAAVPSRAAMPMPDVCDTRRPLLSYGILGRTPIRRSLFAKRGVLCLPNFQWFPRQRVRKSIRLSCKALVVHRSFGFPLVGRLCRTTAKSTAKGWPYKPWTKTSAGRRDEPSRPSSFAMDKFSSKHKLANSFRTSLCRALMPSLLQHNTWSPKQSIIIPHAGQLRCSNESSGKPKRSRVSNVQDLEVRWTGPSSDVTSAEMSTALCAALRIWMALSRNGAFSLKRCSTT